MADKAIDKLFEEMRATAEELTAIQNDEEALQEQLRDLRKRHVAAIKHRDVLDVTLRKHIHTGMPVVQAKMVAHEEMDECLAFSDEPAIANTLRSSNRSENLARVYRDNAMSEIINKL